MWKQPWDDHRRQKTAVKCVLGVGLNPYAETADTEMFVVKGDIVVTGPWKQEAGPHGEAGEGLFSLGSVPRGLDLQRLPSQGSPVPTDGQDSLVSIFDSKLTWPEPTLHPLLTSSSDTEPTSPCPKLPQGQAVAN